MSYVEPSPQNHKDQVMTLAGVDRLVEVTVSGTLLVSRSALKSVARMLVVTIS